MVKHKDVRKHLIEFLGGKCIKCGRTERLEVDHVNPLFKGGKDYFKNLQLLCKKCHAEKTLKDNTKSVIGRKFTIEGFELILKTASKDARSSSSVYVPKKWAGKKVIIVRVEK